MGFLDELKAKAREGLGTAKDKASDLVGDVRDRFGSEESSAGDAAPDTEPTSPVGPADDLGSAAASTDLIGNETYFGGGATGGLDDTGSGAAGTSDTFSDATTGLGEEPAAESGFSGDEVSGGLTDSRDDALDAVQAEDEEIRAAPDQP